MSSRPRGGYAVGLLFVLATGCSALAVNPDQEQRDSLLNSASQLAQCQNIREAPASALQAFGNTAIDGRCLAVEYIPGEYVLIVERATGEYNYVYANGRAVVLPRRTATLVTTASRLNTGHDNLDCAVPLDEGEAEVAQVVFRDGYSSPLPVVGDVFSTACGFPVFVAHEESRLISASEQLSEYSQGTIVGYHDLSEGWTYLFVQLNTAVRRE